MTKKIWGIELKGDQPVKVSIPDGHRVLRLEKATLAELKIGESVTLYATTGGQKLVIGLLSADNSHQLELKLDFEKEVELSHSCRNGTVRLTGYHFINDNKLEHVLIPSPQKLASAFDAILIAEHDIEKLEGLFDREFHDVPPMQSPDFPFTLAAVVVYFQEMFARRVILDVSASIVGERLLLDKLKRITGAHPALKEYEDMLEEIEVSVETNRSFEQSHFSQRGLYNDIEMRTMKINDRRQWPTYPNQVLSLPKPMKFSFPSALGLYKADIQKYFEHEDNGEEKVFLWHDDLCHCKMAWGEREIGVDIFQATVLLLFNEADGRNFKEIQKLTRMEFQRLKSTLRSLMTSGLLKKTPPRTRFDLADWFEVVEDNPPEQLHEICFAEDTILPPYPNT